MNRATNLATEATENTELKMFLEIFAEKVEQLLRYKCIAVKTELYWVEKTNNNSLSLTVSEKGTNLGTNFYIDHIVERWMEDPAGRQEMFNSEAELIASAFIAYRNEEVVDSNAVIRKLSDWEYVKEHVTGRLMNTAANPWIKDCVHKNFLDLSLVYYVVVQENAKGIGTIKISNMMLQQWGVSAEDVMNSYSNTPVLTNMANKMNQLIAGSNDPLMADMILPDTCPDEMMSPAEYANCSAMMPLFVLTNESLINGAACLLEKEFIHEKANGNILYILPSSIHEVLLLPATLCDDPEELRSMVGCVNEDCVADQEVLSDNVYFYDYEKDEFSIC